MSVSKNLSSAVYSTAQVKIDFAFQSRVLDIVLDFCNVSSILFIENFD